jgi:predicted negative regulator of RcsB-dependent stress response
MNTKGLNLVVIIGLVLIVGYKIFSSLEEVLSNEGAAITSGVK